LLTPYEQKIVKKYCHWLECSDHDWHLFMNYGFSDSLQKKNLFETPFCNWSNQANLYKKSLELAAIDFSKNDCSLLEVGCGRGGGLIFLRDNYNFKKLIGLDINANHIKYATHLKKNINFLVGTATNIPCDNESIDVILTVEAIHYFVPFLQYVESCYKTLKKGGILIQTGFENNKKNKKDLLTANGFQFVIEEDISCGVIKSVYECDE